jgi:molecular chaperone GrpE
MVMDFFGFKQRDKEVADLKAEILRIKQEHEAGLKELKAGFDKQIKHKNDLIEKKNEMLERMSDNIVNLNSSIKTLNTKHAKEKQELIESKTNEIIGKFCDILNLFKMAQSSNAKTVDDLQIGVNMIMNSFYRIFESFGIEAIDPRGEKFDPNLHEALYTEASEEVEVGHVIKVLETGFKKNDKIIKYAKVVVCSE